MICDDFDKGTMVNHDLARLTMTLASVACLQTLGTIIATAMISKPCFEHSLPLKHSPFWLPRIPIPDSQKSHSSKTIVSERTES